MGEKRDTLTFTLRGEGSGEKRDLLTLNPWLLLGSRETWESLRAQAATLSPCPLVWFSPVALKPSLFTPLRLTWDISSFTLYPCILETVFILSIMVFLPTKSKLGYETRYSTPSKLHQHSQQENKTLPRRLNIKENLWFHHLSRVIWHILFILTWSGTLRLWHWVGVSECRGHREAASSQDLSSEEACVLSILTSPTLCVKEIWYVPCGFWKD